MLIRLLPAVLFCLSTLASAHEAAPWTAQSNERLARIQRKMDAPEISSPDIQKNVRNYLEHLNKLFDRADYDFPESLANYYLDLADGTRITAEQADVQQMARVVATLHTLMAGMTAENAFPGKEYALVRLTYKNWRAAQAGTKMPEEEAALINKRRTERLEVEKTKALKLQKDKDDERRSQMFMVAGIALVAAMLLGFLLWPVTMYFRRKKLAAQELAAPYVYIKKHGRFPDMKDKAP